MSQSTLTERGQISVPAALRKSMRLRTGQRFTWERISAREFRVTVASGRPAGPLSVLGYALKIRKGPGRKTSDWMRELRAGE